jgi:hypothetical protein
MRWARLGSIKDQDVYGECTSIGRGDLYMMCDSPLS